MSGEIWLREEGNNYYERNREGMEPREDWLLKALRFLQVEPEAVLEVGAANGWRLETLRRIWNCRAVGVDPSRKAVEDGRAKFPKLDLRVGLGEEMNFDNEFDLIIISFVLHWVDRFQLFRFAERVEAALKKDGLLVIADFGYPGFFKRRYHHREGLYTWKADYGNIFVSTGNYLEIMRLRVPYEKREPFPDVSPYDCATLWILKKTDCYREERS